MESIKAQIAEAQKIASGSGSEQGITEAKVELEVCSPEVCLGIVCEVTLCNRFWKLSRARLRLKCLSE